MTDKNDTPQHDTDDNDLANEMINGAAAVYGANGKIIVTGQNLTVTDPENNPNTIVTTRQPGA